MHWSDDLDVPRWKNWDRNPLKTERDNGKDMMDQKPNQIKSSCVGTKEKIIYESKLPCYSNSDTRHINDKL